MTDKRLRDILRDTVFPHRHTTQITSHRSLDNTGQRRTSCRFFRFVVFVGKVSKMLLKNV